MSQAIASRRDATRVFDINAEPRMSAWLRTALRERMVPHPDVRAEPLRPGVQDEARRVVAALEDTMRPATPAEWLTWLRPLRAVLVNAPPDDAAMRGAAVAIASALCDVPASALTAEATREIMKGQRFWPTPADLWSVLKGPILARQAELATLRRIATEAPPPATEPPMTDAQRAEMGARMRALAAELMAGSKNDQRPQDPPRWLNDSELEATLLHAIRTASTPAAAACLRARLAVLHAKRARADAER